MPAVDVLTCYALAGAGSLVGLGLILLVRTDDPRTRQALLLYRMAFICLASFLVVLVVPPESLPAALRQSVAVCAMGAALLAWAFRQLNGQHTPVSVGLFFTVGSGAVLWGAGEYASSRTLSFAVAGVFLCIALGILVDQGVAMRRASHRRGGEMALLVVAALFTLDWLLILLHAFDWEGPYPDHLLFAPDWLLPISAIGIALLPLSVASIVFAIVNDRLNHNLRQRALSDDLTGALSRRGLRERSAALLAGASGGAGVAVLMLDVDHFKAINDRHGHLVGDEVLRHLTQVLRGNLRDDALLARYGGEEFTVVLPLRSRDDAEAVAERLRQVVESHPCDASVGHIRITVSIGVAFHRASHPLEEVLSRADVHLYEAKQAGRNCVICEPPHLASLVA